MKEMSPDSNPKISITLSHHQKERLRKNHYLLLKRPKLGIPLSGVVLDLDGTLYKNDHVAEQMHEIDMEVIANRFGCTKKQAEEIFKTCRKQQDPQLTRIQTIEALGFTQEEWQIVRDSYPLDLIQPDPKMVARLETLQEKGLKIAIATQSTHNGIKNILTRIGVSDFDNMYSFAAGEWGTTVKKHSLEFYKMVYIEMGILPEHLISIGDSVGDAQYPIHLGMSGAVVSGPKGTMEIMDQVLTSQIYY